MSTQTKRMDRDTQKIKRFMSREVNASIFSSLSNEDVAVVVFVLFFGSSESSSNDDNGLFLRH